MRFPLPDKFKDPRVDKYDRSEDPSDHIEGFRAHLTLHSTPDEIACRAFLLTLKGVATEWFGNLKPQSINSFDMLGCKFLNQFLAVRRRKKNPTYLLSLVQGKAESLKDYLQRFNQEKLIVENLDEQTILSALMNGIKVKGLLMAKLARRPTLGTLQQFMRKAGEFINQEETISALTKSKTGNSHDRSDEKEEEFSTKKKRKALKESKKKIEPF
jgi:hypothetical protein